MPLEELFTGKLRATLDQVAQQYGPVEGCEYGSAATVGEHALRLTYIILYQLRPVVLTVHFDRNQGAWRPYTFAFTDGVDECHYRSPDTSIGLRHLQGLFKEVGPRPEGIAGQARD